MRTVQTLVLSLAVSLLAAPPATSAREPAVRSIVPPDAARCNTVCKSAIANERKDPEAAEGCLINCMAAERQRAKEKAAREAVGREGMKKAQ